MKRLIAVVLGCTFFSGATASDWIEVNNDEDGATFVNIGDLKSQKLKNTQSVGAWVKSVYKIPQINQDISNDEPIKEFWFMRWYQCQGRTVSDPVEVVFYGVDGNFVNSYSEDTSMVSFQHVTPDTIESNIHTVVCTVDLANQIEKIKERGPVNDYEYRRLENEYPYQFRLLQNYDGSN